jgi:NADH:ubiquinone oxidoreductase subunit 4 (subunit M)
MQKVFFGQGKSNEKIKDLSSLETLAIASVVFLLVYLGLNPGPVTRAVEPSVKQIISKVEAGVTGEAYRPVEVNRKRRD